MSFSQLRIWILVLILMVSSLGLSSIASANENEDNGKILFSVNDQVTLNDEITLLPGSLIYGELNKENTNVLVQYNSQLIEIPSKNLVRVEDPSILSNTSSSILDEDYEIMKFSTQSVLKQNLSSEKTQGHLAKESDLLVKQGEEADEGIYSILIGNITYFISEGSKEAEEETAPEKEEKEQTPEEAKEPVTSLEESAEQLEQEKEVSGQINTKTESSIQKFTIQQSNTEYFEVISDNVPAYDNSTGALVEVAQLQKGQVYHIFTDYGNWHGILVGGKTVYVWKKSTQLVSKPLDINFELGKTKGELTANILKQANAYLKMDKSSRVAAKLNADKSFPVVENYGEWFKVKVGERYLFIEAGNGRINFNNIKGFQVVTDTTPIYDNRTGKLVEVGHLTKGQVYPIYSDFTNWHRIKFGDYFVYARKNHTIPFTGSIPKESKNSTVGPESIDILDETVVNDNSTGKLLDIGTLLPGQTIPIIKDFGNWFEIEYSGRIGYVSKATTRIHFESDQNRYVVSRDTPVYDNGSGSLVKVGTLEKGQVYDRVKDFSNWHEIRFGEKNGYVLKNDTMPYSGSIINPNKKSSLNHYFVANQTTEVYDNSTGSLIEFAKIEKGARYSILEEFGNWYKIDVSGRNGFVRKDDVSTLFPKEEQYFRVYKDKTAIYDNSTGSLVPVGYLYKNQTYKRIKDFGNWHEIKFGNINGYIRKSDTSMGTPERENNFLGSSITPSQVFTAKKNLTVYDNSSGKLVKMGEILEGQVYPYLSKSGSWATVDFGGRSGLVAGEDINIDGMFIETPYNISFSEAARLQFDRAAPQNDTSKYDAWIRWDAFSKIDSNNVGITDGNWNVRGGPGTNYWKLSQIEDLERIEIIGSQTVEGVKWYKINLYRTWKYNSTKNQYEVYYRAFVNSSMEDLEYYMDPENFINDDRSKYQFLLLSSPAGTSAREINEKILLNKGNLSGKGAAFIEAAETYSINEIYLMGHALLETGAGSSRESSLLKGHPVSVVDGKQVKPRNVYNVYGIAAYDKCEPSPVRCASEYAYKQGWFSVEDAIIGGAKFIGETYIYHPDYRQNTLYEMRWNPFAVEQTGWPAHQYATDIGWADKQAKGYIYNFYSLLEQKREIFEIPYFK
ncbi:hypothetical protein D3H55_01695 [Bacillus salacetis]|uniref:Mannosyl-glycoprotein endo-beta-N-acetylglucosamidase-like domain-containing protein n=1 Tax=Bacillus salacetis TaxID=2315464 RepID=A0A3A1R880_9BACI|nr:N-acetylglucosaminidase [Bacillus salacetis]RIW39090.1 hypothetical protein D3H55_01695 [Bacillus salacetis]